MKLTLELAEVLGMFVADGCLQRDYLCMWGNINQDKQYYDKAVCPLFSSVFNVSIKPHEKKSNSVYGFYLCKRNALDILKNIGFKFGKKTYNVKVPSIILDSKNGKIYSAFIRGFTDCDGYLNFDKRFGTYSLFKRKFNVNPRIYLKSVSEDLIKGISYMLKQIGIEHSLRKHKSNKFNEKDVFIIVIRGKERLEKWMNKIGFKNPVQITRYQIWKKFEFCPPFTTLRQRESILAGKIDPKAFYKNKRTRRDSNPRSSA